MSHSKASRRKRKYIDHLTILSDVEINSSQEDSDVEIVESNAKIPHLQITTSLDSNLELVSAKNSIVDGEIKIIHSNNTSSQDVFISQDAEYCTSQPSISSTKNGDISDGIIPASEAIDSYQSDVVISDLDATVDTIVIPSQESNSNTDCYIQEDLDEHITITQKLLQLQAEIQQLKLENERFRSTSCTCNNVTRDLAQPLIATITFNKCDNYELYKKQFLNYFQSCLNFSVTERASDLTIELSKADDGDWTTVDTTDHSKEKHKKSKRKKKKKKEEVVPSELFVLDTSCQVESDKVVHYKSKFNLSSQKLLEDDDVKVRAAASLCFNCNESHNLRDCPQPRDYQKINAARQKFKVTLPKPTIRYHLDDDQKFEQIMPGVISDELRYALSLRDDQLPEHIYVMRQIGYPPGWYQELKTSDNSSLMLFDFEGNNDSISNAENDIDPSKVVEYSGFNVPLQKGIKDEYRLHGCRPYSKECNKNRMLDDIRANLHESRNNSNNHLRNSSKFNPNGKNSPSMLGKSTSPTLNDLENQKEKLLSELVDANDDSRSNSIVMQENDEAEDAGFKTIDECSILDTTPQPNSPLNNTSLKTLDETGVDLNVTAESVLNSPSVHSVRNTTFGTPILCSLSPYSRLPRPENFQRDVSDVINFENLPDSTGKYEKQMVGVLHKVRNQMKHLSSL